MTQPTAPTAQKGMALLVVLLIVALLVMLATAMAGRFHHDLRRTTQLTAGRQAYWLALGMEQLIPRLLNEDIPNATSLVHLDQVWAQSSQVFEVEEGGLTGRVTDQQACFNLNSLTQRTPGVNADNLTQQPYPIQVFYHVLRSVDIPDAAALEILAATQDWVDADPVPVTGQGAEDNAYDGLKPPYLPANQRFFLTDELRAVRGITAARYQKLAPLVCALPTDKLSVNVNTVIAPELLQGLYLGRLDQASATDILDNRPQQGWPNTTSFLQQPALQALGVIPDLNKHITVSSGYFLVNLAAKAGDQAHYWTTLWQRSQSSWRLLYRVYDEPWQFVPEDPS